MSYRNSKYSSKRKYPEDSYSGSHNDYRQSSSNGHYGNSSKNSQYGNRSYNDYDGYNNKRFNSGDDFRLQKQDWSQLRLPSFEKNFYREHKDVARRSPSEIARFMEEKEIKVLTRGAPNPIYTFKESGLPEDIQDSIHKLGFTTPTPIQSQSWPIILSGHDMIGVAQTGSGKTLSFLLPAIKHIKAQEPLRRGDGPIALVIAPTRELACQISDQIPPFSSSRLRHAAIYGGAPKGRQLRQLSCGVEIVIATPGRLLDFISAGNTNLRRVTYLVLDEADRMLDMGFEPSIRQILSQIRPERQTVLFSATWPKEIQHLAAEFLRKPMHVNIGAMGLAACKNVKQEFKVVDDHSKFTHLLHYLQGIEKDDKVLIFVATKVGTNELSQSLRSGGFYSGAINGDKRQSERENVLRRFRNGEISILVGTDVASRGIDIKDITVVVNYDFPNTIEDYVHRVGRTGRASAKGRSFTMLNRKNGRKVSGLITMLRNGKIEIPRELEQLGFQNGPQRRFRGSVNRFRR